MLTPMTPPVLWPAATRREPLGTAFALHLPATRPSGEPPVVLVHGYRGLAVEWGPVAERVAATRDVWAPELSAPPGTRGLAPVHALLDRVAERSGDGPVDVVGSSMGGFVSLSWAAARPASVRRLTLLAPAAVPLQEAWRVPGLTRLVALQRVLDADERKWEQVLASATPDTFFEADTATHGQIPLPWREAVLAALSEGVGTAAATGRVHARQEVLRALMATLRGDRMAQLLGRVTAPVVWLHGDPDKRVPYAPSRAAAGHLPHGTFETLEGVGHLIHLECPDLVAARVSR